jgi:hypothetical protein
MMKRSVLSGNFSFYFRLIGQTASRGKILAGSGPKCYQSAERNHFIMFVAHGLGPP